MSNAAPGGGRNADAGQGISTYRSYNQQIIVEALQALEQANGAAAVARADLANHERVKAQLAAAGVAAQTSAGMDMLIEAAKARINAAMNKVGAAEKERGAATQNIERLASGGHDETEVAMKGASDKVARTGWYEGT
jgi:hypothetical protein